MQKQTIGHDFSIEEIENLVDKILKEVSTIPEFKYEELFKEKAKRFLQDFEKKSLQFKQSHIKQPYNLQLLFKSEPVVQITPSQQQNPTKTIKSTLSPPNIFLYSFELPCRYQNYEQMIRNSKIQSKLDEMISSYEIKEEIVKNESLKAQIVELSYKRVLIISSREFVNVRLFFKENQINQSSEKIYYWIVTFSIPYEKKTDKTTAEIILTAQKIEENLQKNKINIKVYSQVDMKTAAKPDMARNKGFAEIKKYVNKLYDYSKQMK